MARRVRSFVGNESRTLSTAVECECSPRFYKVVAYFGSRKWFASSSKNQRTSCCLSKTANGLPCRLSPSAFPSYGTVELLVRMRSSSSCFQCLEGWFISCLAGPNHADLTANNSVALQKCKSSHPTPSLTGGWANHSMMGEWTLPNIDKSLTFVVISHCAGSSARLCHSVSSDRLTATTVARTSLKCGMECS